MENRYPEEQIIGCLREAEARVRANQKRVQCLHQEA